MDEFPIMVGYEGTAGPCPSSIPWDAIAPYEGNAQENHQQSLERLAQRGGLSPVEAFLVMTGRRWRGETFTKDLEKEACAFLDNLVKDRQIDKLRIRSFQIMTRSMATVLKAWLPASTYDDFIRVAGEAICEKCRLPFREHPEIEPTFHVECFGRLVKT